MSWIDLVLALVIASSVLTGFAAGFARVGVGFAALIVGMFCGFWFYGIVAAYVIDYVTSRAIANLIGFFVILIAVLILGAIVGRILAKFFKWVGLSWLDRLLGGAFGVVRGFLIAAVMVTVLLAFSPSPPPPSVVDSRFLPYVINVSDVLAAVTPHEIKDSFYATKDKVKAVWSAHNTRKPGELRHE
ncbi:MAG: CvpA family protein [Bryobacteraceae bacterium]|jgi:membrane protein required for colicin V production